MTSLKDDLDQLQRLGYFGSQKFYLAESADELTHYQKIVDFMNDMGDVASIPDVKGIDDEIKDIEDALNVSYETELDLLEQYKEFYENAEDEDVTVAQFLLQFIEIQRLAVGEYGDLISKYDAETDYFNNLFNDETTKKMLINLENFLNSRIK